MLLLQGGISAKEHRSKPAIKFAAVLITCPRIEKNALINNYINLWPMLKKCSIKGAKKL
jgi:hypothetical protein